MLAQRTHKQCTNYAHLTRTKGWVLFQSCCNSAKILALFFFSTFDTAIAEYEEKIRPCLDTDDVLELAAVEGLKELSADCEAGGALCVCSSVLRWLFSVLEITNFLYVLAFSEVNNYPNRDSQECYSILQCWEPLKSFFQTAQTSQKPLQLNDTGRTME